MDNSSEICNLSLSGNVRKELVAILSSGGFAGVLSCGSALILLVFFRMYRTFSERLVLYLLLSGFFFASVLTLQITGDAFDFSQHHSLCQGMGFILQYAIWILVLLTTFIVFHLASLVFFYKTFNKSEPFLVLFAVIFPLLFSWVPFIHDTYGLSGAWCWIRVYRHTDCHFYSEGLIEQYALWYGPFFLLLIVNAAITIAIVVALCHRSFKKQSLTNATSAQGEFGTRVRFQELDQDDQQSLTNATSAQGAHEFGTRVRFQDLDQDDQQSLTNATSAQGEFGTRVQELDQDDQQATQYKKALKNTLPLLAYPIIYSFLSWFALANRIRRAISPGSSFSAWVVHAVTAPSWAFFLGVAFIVYLIAGRKLSKRSIKAAYYNWKPKLTAHTVGFTNRCHGTDVFTRDGYTPSEAGSDGFYLLPIECTSK